MPRKKTSISQLQELVHTKCREKMRSVTFNSYKNFLQHDTLWCNLLKQFKALEVRDFIFTMLLFNARISFGYFNYCKFNLISGAKGLTSNG